MWGGWLMSGWPVRASELHRRASTFLAKYVQPLDALEHAQLSGDEKFLADQLDLLSEDLVYTGYLYRIDELAADLPWKTLANRPNLLLALAWRRIRTPEFASAEKLIGAAEDRKSVV